MAAGDGHIIVTNESGFWEADIRTCCHCGLPWIVVPGSGRIRGRCYLCGADHCGAPRCWEHSPIEKRLDGVESGRLPLRAL